MTTHAYIGADIFDGERRHRGMALLVESARVVGIVAETDVPDEAEATDIGGGTLAPGFVDLQVNGGAGVMFNDAPTAQTLGLIAGAHAGLGTTSLLPTLITDTPEHSRAAVEAAQKAVERGTPGIAGLHLEGPHLSVARKGAHGASFIRPINDADMALYVEAAKDLPALMLTIAPETVPPEQIATLTDAGVIVSLGHTDADFETCVTAAKAGAICSTHLFNAMSGLGNREPGCVGATLATGRLSAGLIADGIHVHPAAISAALRAKLGPGEIFLVSDAMSPAGTEQREFTLNGRRILRENGRLTLEDGTLAGADLDMAQAIRTMVNVVGCEVDVALRMATLAPANLLPKANGIGQLTEGGPADFVWLDDDLRLRGTWQAGEQVRA
ncbi:N-acetylglucosamine-6-phosphate deacetylase [Aliiroseovarius sp. YM-037]|uniref:N-acetylglucosamine-6-phosphate deacetylase n=1 Tax=Aliiroseovarius sp. YM-037 TaxID=3341728 RepID=UPI003A80A881